MKKVIILSSHSVIFALLAVIPFFAEAADVSGTLTINNKNFKISHGYVDMAQPHEPMFVLSDRPLPSDQIPFLEADYAEREKVHAVVFGVSAGDKKLHAAMKWVYFGGSADIPFSVLHDDKVSLLLKQLDSSLADGKIRTLQKVTLSDLSYSFDISFKLSLKEAIAAASSPKQVSFTGDNSPPVIAYREYYTAIMEGNVTAMKKYMTSQALREFELFDPKDREMALELLKMRPVQLNIGKPEISGARAVFSAEGKEGSATAVGSIIMIRENDIWKVLEDRWNVTSK